MIAQGISIPGQNPAYSKTFLRLPFLGGLFYFFWAYTRSSLPVRLSRECLLLSQIKGSNRLSILEPISNSVAPNGGPVRLFIIANIASKWP